MVEPNPQINIRPATAKDFEDLRRIGFAEMPFARLKGMPVGYIEAIKERFWSDESFSDSLSLGDDSILLAEHGYKVVGFGEFAKYVHGEIFINKLYVHRDYQGKDIGAKLLDEYINRRDFLVKWVRTEVLKDDRGTRKFYEHQGYKAGKPYTWDLDGVVLQAIPLSLKRWVKFKSQLDREASAATESTRFEEEAKASKNKQINGLV